MKGFSNRAVLQAAYVLKMPEGKEWGFKMGAIRLKRGFKTNI